MGKDNIVFHSQIWPAELLGYNGEGDKGGEPGSYGKLNLPRPGRCLRVLDHGGTEVLLVPQDHDLRSRRAVPLPAGRATLLHLDRRPRDLRLRLHLGRVRSPTTPNWWPAGVASLNRTAAMIAKNFGEIPEPGQLEDIDNELLAEVRKGFETVGGAIENHHQRSALAEVMRIIGEANAYVSRTEPFKLKAPEERERLATILHTLIQSVSDINTMMSVFLPHSSNAIDKVIGGSGDIAPMPRMEGAEDLDGGGAYPIITGDYSNLRPWESVPVTVGTPISKPKPVFVKLDPEVVDEELARLDLQ